MTAACLDIEELDGVAVVALSGDLDAGSVPELDRLLHRLVKTGKKYVVVDMAGTSFVGNSIMSVLLGFAGQLSQRDGGVKMCAVPDTVGEILEIFGVCALVPVFNDRAGALITYPEDIRQHLGVRERRSVEDRRKTGLHLEGEDRRKTERRGMGSDLH